MEYSKEQAFVDTVQAKSHQLYRIAMSLLHSSQDAEDAVSDAIEATWKNLWRRRTEVAEKDCGKIRLAEESKTAERTKIKNA